MALPTYDERESIRQCINDFFATGVVDEVVVCNNNAAAGTSEEVAATSAREVREPRQVAAFLSATPATASGTRPHRIATIAGSAPK